MSLASTSGQKTFPFFKQLMYIKKGVTIRIVNREQYRDVVTNVCHQRGSREGAAACKGGRMRDR